MLTFEHAAQREGFRLVLGIDEAGRGPLAGPVVAAAVLLRVTQFDHPIRDSKKLSARQRERAFHEILDKAYVGVGMMSEQIIDSHNIARATYMAMTNAVLDLRARLPADVPLPIDQTCLLVDGNRFETDLPYTVRTIIGGDAVSLSIACASIVAKVSRDRILVAYDQIYPQYGFRTHKGYPTRQHREAIKAHGLSPIHRTTYQTCL